MMMHDFAHASHCACRRELNQGELPLQSSTD
jgi:hypothetical protein